MVSNRKIVVAARCTHSLYSFRLNLMRALRKDGWEVLAVGISDPKYDQLIRDEGFSLFSLKKSVHRVNPISEFFNLLRLFGFFWRTKPDVVHSFSIRPVIFASLAAKAAGVPRIVCTVSGLGHAFISAGFAVRHLVRVLYRLALASADLVFFQNSDDRKVFLDLHLVSASKTRLIAGSGVDLNKFQVTKRDARESCGRFEILMVARLLREKGVLEFVQAAKELAQSNGQFHFTLLGGEDPLNPSSLSMAEVRRLANIPAFEIVGHTDDVRPYLERADVVVLPSYREGVPRSLLEAAAAGLPLVATDVPGCRDVVVDGVNGFLVPARDSQNLVRALETMFALTPAERMRFGDQSRSLVEKKFDERNVISETKRAYLENRC